MTIEITVYCDGCDSEIEVIDIFNAPIEAEEWVVDPYDAYSNHLCGKYKPLFNELKNGTLTTKEKFTFLFPAEKTQPSCFIWYDPYSLTYRRYFATQGWNILRLSNS